MASLSEQDRRMRAYVYTYFVGHERPPSLSAPRLSSQWRNLPGRSALPHLDILIIVVYNYYR